MVGQYDTIQSPSRGRSTLGALLRMARWMLLGIAALGVAVVASWRLIADETLDPQVREDIAIRLVPPSRDNGYFLMIGFGVEEGVDPERAGRRYVVTHDRLLAAQKNLDYFDGQAALASPTLKLPAEKPCSTTPNTAPTCLAEYRQNAVLIRRQLEELAPYLERYRRLKSYREFVAPFSRTSVQSANPGLQVVMRMGDLVDASIALRMESASQREAALRELADEVAFWRQFVGKTDWILSQMIATRMLTFKLMLASELMTAHPEIVREHADLIAKITEPMRPEEASIAGAVSLEMFFIASFIWDLASGDSTELWSVLGESFVDRLLGAAAPMALVGAFKPQATLNEYVPAMRRNVAAAGNPPAQFAAAVAAANAANQAARTFRPWDIFFNPLGRLLVHSATAPDFSTYTYRLWDAVALSRLVELQRRMIDGKVAAADVPAATAASAKELGDLYTGEPARWDASANTLSFESRGKRFLRDGRIAVTYRP